MERGFRLSWKSVPVAAVQRMMAVLQDIYPNYSTKLYIVNLPSYLGWFVRFVKGFLCEASAEKIELIDDEAQLLDLFDEQGLPSSYRQSYRERVGAENGVAEG